MSKNKDIISISLGKLRAITIFLAILLFVVIGVYVHHSLFSNNPKKLDSVLTQKDPIINKVDIETKKSKLALIIDDFGQNQAGVNEIMEINRPLTIAVMPFLSFSKKDAQNAHKHGFEVIVHLPMQSQNVDIKSWLGPSPVEVSQNDSQVDNIVDESINNIPYAVGVNIHMGALASEDARVMGCVMSFLKKKDLYFIDSRTTSKTVCDRVADEVGLEYGKRNVFIDNGQKDKEYIKKQLVLAADTALKKGYAIAIGHVGSMGGVGTAECIKEMIPKIEAMGVEFVFVSQIVK